MLTLSDESDCVICRDPAHGREGGDAIPCQAPTVRFHEDHFVVIACPCTNYLFLPSRRGFHIFSMEVIHD